MTRKTRNLAEGAILGPGSSQPGWKGPHSKEKRGKGEEA